MSKRRVYLPGEALSLMVPWRSIEAVDVSSASWADPNNFEPTSMMVRVSGDVGITLLDDADSSAISIVYLAAGVPYSMEVRKIWTSVTSTDVSSTNIFIFK